MAPSGRESEIHVFLGQDRLFGLGSKVSDTFIPCSNLVQFGMACYIK